MVKVVSVVVITVAVQPFDFIVSVNRNLDSD